jgi:hypothetical protein
LGACVGLFFLAVFYRFLFALRAVVDLKWALANNVKTKKQTDECCPEPNVRPPFSLKVDVPRGLLEGLLSVVGYLLMLAVSLVFRLLFYPEALIPLVHSYLLGYGNECVVLHRGLCLYVLRRACII